MITITLLNNGKDRYTMSSNSFYLGRKYDDNAQEYQVIFPQEEIDAGHTCKMIVTACNGSIPVDTIPMSSGVTKLIRSNLSQYDRIEIGFTFEGENNYRKNSEIRYFYFYDAQMPDGFIPATPEINTIVDEAFCGVQWKDGVDNTLQFTNLAGQVKDEINLGEFVQEQADLAETDDTKGTFVKNKSTKYLENEGEDGTSPYATVQYVNDEDDGLQSQIDVVNDNITNLENKVADALDDISTIDTAINKNVVSGIGVSTNVDNVSINSNIVNIKTGATSTDTDAIPLANDTTAGLISHSDYQQIRQNTEDIAVLKGQTIRIAYSVKPNPTAQEINDFVVAQGYTQDQFPQIAVVVTGTNYVWRYYANDGWTQQTDVVSIFTNDTAGIIKGSTASGKIYAETDGTGSVNGWDNLTNDVTSLNTNKQDKLDQTQLAAVNSGIDSTKVAQIATNTTNIVLKADKVTNATNGNFAGLDANGNLIDSRKKASDFSKVEVSATGTATDEIGYITVDGVEKKLAGGGDYLSATDPVGTGSLSMNRKANTTVGTNSVALGKNCEASGGLSIAIGTGCTSTGGYGCFAEGYENTATSGGAHAEGRGNTASGEYSHAEGGFGKSSGYASHSEGVYTTASGNYSHSEGFNTIAQRQSQHVFGEYNIADAQGTTTTHGQFVEIVGNGTSHNARSNARTLDWSGNEMIAGNLQAAGLTDGTTTKTMTEILAGGGSVTETTTLAPTDWTALSSSDPYTYQATITATATIGANSIVELFNDNAVTFATYGFAIGSVSGQNITIYSIGQPSASVDLTIGIGG